MKSPEKMSLKELLSAEAIVKDAMLRARDKARARLREQMEAIAAKRGFTLRELFPRGNA